MQSRDHESIPDSGRAPALDCFIVLSRGTFVVLATPSKVPQHGDCGKPNENHNGVIHGCRSHWDCGWHAEKRYRQ